MFVFCCGCFIRNYYFLLQFFYECVFMSVCPCECVFVFGCEFGRTNVNFICIKWSKNESSLNDTNWRILNSILIYLIWFSSINASNYSNNALKNMGHTMRDCDQRVRINRVARNSDLLANWFGVYFNLHSSHIKKKRKISKNDASTKLDWVCVWNPMIH